jgi:hypothetical protein
MSAAQNAGFEKLRRELDQTQKSLTRMIESLGELDEQKLNIDARMERHLGTITPWKYMGQGPAGEEIAPVEALGDTNMARLHSVYDPVHSEYQQRLKRGRDIGGRLAQMGHGVLR